MSTITTLLQEMDQEAKTTRNMLGRIPNDKFDWQPHPRSMTIRNLGTHLSELPSWVQMALTTDGLDFEKNPYHPKKIDTTAGLLQVFEESLASARAQLAAAKEADLEPGWTLSIGSKVLVSYPSKVEVIRMTYSQIVHHRAQLGVFLRLLDIPIPGSYGPSADEANF
jgi:uncharacterized damage-inducible protein DinB